MKKSIFTIAVLGTMALTMFTGCSSSTKKVEDAKENVKNAKKDMIDASENVVEAKQELTQAVRDSIKEFRKKTEEQLIANEKSLALFNAKIAKINKENRADYQKEYAKLVKKNQEMKTRLDNYNEEKDGNWEKFKTEFNRDMKELGEAFKNLTVKNVK